MAFSYSLAGVPDLDQQWTGLAGHGANHCVPACAMNWMYYYRGKGVGTAVKYAPENHSDHRRLNIGAMGEYMCVDADSGASSSDAFDGLCDWMGDRGLFGLVSDRRARDNENIRYTSIRNLLKGGANIIMSFGRYHWDDGEFERSSAHALTLVSLTRTDAGVITMGLHDPNNDKTHLNSQSETTTRTAVVDEQTRNIEGDSVHVLRWGTATDPYIFFDGWLAIQPIFLLSYVSGSSLAHHSADIGTGALTSVDIPLPFKGTVADLALDVPNYGAAVIHAETGDVWQLELADNTWQRVAGTTNARLLTFGGRKRRLFVHEAHDVKVFDTDGKHVTTFAAGGAVDAMSYDHANDRLIVLTQNATQLLAVDPQMKVIERMQAPRVAGAGRTLLSVHGRSAEITLSRNGNLEGVKVHWTAAGATAHSGSGADPGVRNFALRAAGATAALHVNNDGRQFAVDQGRVAFFDADGQRMRSPFEGVRVGDVMKVARSTSILDRERSRRPNWRVGG